MEYILILVWIGLIALISRSMQFKRTVLVDGVEQERYVWLFAFIVVFPVVLMAGFRDELIGDTWGYISGFKSTPNSFSELGDYFSTITKDKGFYYITAVIKALGISDYRMYLMIIAVFQGLVLCWFYRRYSSNYIFSIFLFIASADYVSWMFNGIRQFTAVVIVLLATPFFLKKKYLIGVLIILLASTMHQSALIMIPIAFLAQGKAWNRRTILFLFAAIITLFFVNHFTSLLDNLLSDTQYHNVVSDYTYSGDDGTNPLRVLVYSAPAIMSFVFRKHIRESDDKLINLCTNMSVFSLGLYLLSMVTSGIFLGRLPIYCSMFSYVLLPWEIESISRDDKSKKILYLVIIVAYILFYYYQMHVAWNLI